MAFCPHCGAKIEGGPKFCAKCGFSLVIQKKTEAEEHFERGLELLKESHPAGAIPEFEKVLELRPGHEGAIAHLKEAREALALREYYFCKHCASLIVQGMEAGSWEEGAFPEFCPNCKHRLEMSPAAKSELKVVGGQLMGGATLILISALAAWFTYETVWKTAYFGLHAKYALTALIAYLAIFLWCAPIPFLSTSAKWQVKKYADAKEWYGAALKAFFIEFAIVILILLVLFLGGMRF